MRVLGLASAMVNKDGESVFHHSLVGGERKQCLNVLDSKRFSVRHDDLYSMRNAFADFVRIASDAMSDTEHDVPFFLMTGSNQNLQDRHAMGMLRHLQDGLEHNAPDYADDLLSNPRARSTRLLVKCIEFSHTAVVRTLAKERGIPVKSASLEYHEDDAMEAPEARRKSNADSEKTLRQVQEGGIRPDEACMRMGRNLAGYFLQRHPDVNMPLLKFLKVQDKAFSWIADDMEVREAFGNALRRKVRMKGNFSLKFPTDPWTPPLTDPLAGIMADYMDGKTHGKPGLVLARPQNT